ncbi:MAG: hypothetical protein ACTILK_01515, partial [Bifidobacterium crudilactis]|uniref:hypothetical protein n=1 Tax=Bifidobacterium crudilactis TaxID=327277 RepID=UPI003F978F16
MLLKVIMTISDVECIANRNNACIPVHLTISGLLTLRLSAADMHGGAAWWLYALWGNCCDETGGYREEDLVPIGNVSERRR